jgi:predicted CXXCH cytochrome family protein
MVQLRLFGIAIFALVVPAFAFAAGAHDGLNCVGCHSIHAAKSDIIFGVEPNKKAVNPKTKQPFAGVTALCLGCHETIERGGMGIAPVSATHSHPYGVSPNAKVANVPDALIRDGKLECVGCHDPHPSNPNYKYLRVDTVKGGKMTDFCAMCHSSKADPGTPKNMKIFNSMNESAVSAPAAPAKK